MGSASSLQFGDEPSKCVRSLKESCVDIKSIVSDDIWSTLGMNVVKESGSGTYARVLKVIDVFSTTTKALKVPSIEASEYKEYGWMNSTELSILFGKRRPYCLYGENIVFAPMVQMVQMVQMGIVMPYLATSVQKLDRSISWSMKISIVYRIGLALRAMHADNILHCDVHGDNILIDVDKDQVFLSDFGASQFVLTTQFGFFSNSDRVSWTWRPPENVKGHDNDDDMYIYTAATDVWCLGYLLLTLLLDVSSIYNDLDDESKLEGRQRYLFRNELRKHSILTRWLRRVEPSRFRMRCIDLLSRTLTYSPRNRISLTHFLCHPLFSGLAAQYDTEETMKKDEAKQKEKVEIEQKENEKDEKEDASPLIVQLQHMAKLVYGEHLDGSRILFSAVDLAYRAQCCMDVKTERGIEMEKEMEKETVFVMTCLHMASKSINIEESYTIPHIVKASGLPNQYQQGILTQEIDIIKCVHGIIHVPRIHEYLADYSQERDIIHTILPYPRRYAAFCVREWLQHRKPMDAFIRSGCESLNDLLSPSCPPSSPSP